MFSKFAFHLLEHLVFEILAAQIPTPAQRFEPLFVFFSGFLRSSALRSVVNKGHLLRADSIEKVGIIRPLRVAEIKRTAD
jgi:hypothetical protein